MIENSESDDDSLEAVCGDDDETFSCCEDAIPGLWAVCNEKKLGKWLYEVM